MENRIILFIDILGFSNFVYEQKNNDWVETYKKIFQKWRIKEDSSKLGSGHFINDPESNVFSDSILISYPERLTEEYLEDYPDEFRKKFGDSFSLRRPSELFHYAFKIQREIFLSFGLLTRGIIHIGPLHHENNIILGKGFIDAYTKEKELKYPVIYLSDTAIERCKDEINQSMKKPSPNNIYQNDHDQIYLFPAGFLGDESKESVQKAISDGIKNAPDDKAKEKWKWIENQLNNFE